MGFANTRYAKVHVLHVTRVKKVPEVLSHELFCRCRTRNILDDFREAYYWLRQNTEDKARVMSWWDYGYQIAGMGNRTTLVDNNTWNNSHIAMVPSHHSYYQLLLSTFFRYKKNVKFFPSLTAHRAALISVS